MDAISKSSNILSLFSTWRWPWVIFTLAVFSLLFNLGLWQASRAEEKQLRLDKIAAMVGNDRLSLQQLLSQKNKNDLPVAIQGKFNNEQILLLDNQTNQGRLGYRVLQVFNVLNTDRAVLINMGWVEGSINRTVLPQLSTFPGQITINGNVRIIEKGIVLQQQTYQQVQWPLRIQQIEINEISQLFNTKLLPFVIYLDTKEEIGYKKNWQPIVMPPQKHLGYAVQWFSLAFVWLALMIWASYKQQNKLQNKSANNNK